MRKYLVLLGLTIVCLKNQLQAQIGGKESFSITYNVYRTWTEGEIPAEFNKLKWQVKFLTSNNSIEQYWERDGFPATKFKLWKSFEVVESKKVATYVYSYSTRNGLIFYYNSESPSSIVMQEGNKYTEYAYYNSHYNKFE